MWNVANRPLRFDPSASALVGFGVIGGCLMLTLVGKKSLKAEPAAAS